MENVRFLMAMPSVIMLIIVMLSAMMISVLPMKYLILSVSLCLSQSIRSILFLARKITVVPGKIT
jgi:hypothetical protein